MTRLVIVLRDRQTWALEYFLAWQALVWGLWLLLPFRSFDVLPNAYTLLGLVPEPIWGVLFTGHGAAYLVVLWRRHVDLCRRAALVTAWLWLTVLVSLLLTIPIATSTPVYAGYVVACMVVYVRLDWFVRPRRRA